MSQAGGAGGAAGAGRRGRPGKGLGSDPVAAPRRTSRSRKTRAAILTAARRLFASRGFEQVSLREIGAEARTDPALIARYFGGKARLFAETLAASHDPVVVFGDDLAGFAHRAARAAVLGEWEATGLERLLIALRSASSPEVSDWLIRPFEQQFVQGLAQRIAGEERTVRAHIVFSCIVGAAHLHGMRAPRDPTDSKGHAHIVADRFAHDLHALMARAG